MRRMLVTAGILALVATGCAQETPESERDDETTEPAAVTITATDFAFAGDTSIPGGLVRVTLENKGAESHQAQLVKLNDGETKDTYLDSLEKDPSAAGTLEIAEYEGGPNGVVAGGSGSATIDLPEGSFLLMCFISSPDGKPHFTKGMVSELDVTAPETDVAEPGEADATIRTTEFDFDTPSGLEPGESTIEVFNDGEQVHEAGIVRIEAGKDLDDVKEFFGSQTPSGPPPFSDAGGTAAIQPGATTWVDVDLEAGSYGLVCFVPDPESKEPHVAKGMLASFSVGAAASPGS